MGEHPFGRNLPARKNVAREREGRGDLTVRKGRRVAVVARIGDLDPDRGRVEVALAFPMRLAGVPGAPALGHELNDPPVLEDEIMRRHFRRRVDEQLQRRLGRRHAGVMEDEGVRPRFRHAARRNSARGRTRRRAGCRRRDRSSWPVYRQATPARPVLFHTELSCTRRRKCGCHRHRIHAARSGADASRRCR